VIIWSQKLKVLQPFYFVSHPHENWLYVWKNGTSLFWFAPYCITMLHWKFTHYSFFLAFSVWARHELLQGSIGTYPEEDFAFWFITTLSWVLPLTIFIASLVDMCFAILYMKKAHPWKSILTDEEKKKRKKKRKKKEKKEKQKKNKYAQPWKVMSRHFP